MRDAAQHALQLTADLGIARFARFHLIRLQLNYGVSQQQQSTMTGTLQVRRADTNDITAIYDILAAAGQALVQEGFRNWATSYSIERIHSDVLAREVYVIVQDQTRVGTYTLGGSPIHPYDPPPWPQPEARALYLNRMAVTPALRSRGLGSFALAQIAVRAQNYGVGAIRCDVLEANTGLRGFYQRNGYVPWGTRTHSGWRFVCYQRAVGPADPAEHNAPAG